MPKDVYLENQYKNIATNTTTDVYSGQCILHSITINKAAAGAITVYDEATSGSTAIIATIASNNAAGTYIYDVSCSKGIQVVTAAASDITVSWRKA